MRLLKKKKEYIIFVMPHTFSINSLRLSSPGAFPDSIRQGPFIYLFTKCIHHLFHIDSISGTRERRMITTQFLPSRGSQSRKIKSYNAVIKVCIKYPAQERCLWGSPMVFRNLPTGCEEAGTEKDISGRWDSMHRGPGGGDSILTSCAFLIY